MNRKNKKGAMAISQIIILLIGILAISWAIGSSIGEVSAAPVKFADTILGKGTSFYKSLFSKGFKTDILAAVATAIIVYGIYKLTRDEDMAAVASALGSGFGAVQAASMLKFAKLGAAVPWIVGGIVVATILFDYRKQFTEVISFTGVSWQAQKKGENCERCNQQGDLPCSLYQCKSLGQGCDLINPGTSEEGCVWVHRNDNVPPIIQAWSSKLSKDYKYTPERDITPTERGVQIVPKDPSKECVEAFTPLLIGVALDEPAQCKIDGVRKDTYDSMSVFMGGSLLKYNHSFELSLPGSNALEAENITLLNDGDYELYVRCSDANDNTNVANFVFKYCVDKGPDTTAPIIESTSILNNAPIQYEKESVELSITLNEPSQCRWSYQDKSYGDMETEFTGCVTSVFASSYTCKTTLNGLNDYIENDFYFKCKDQPKGVEEDKRNENSQSYKFTLIGTEPLVINDFGPNETIRGSTTEIKVDLRVETFAGYKEGESVCEFSADESRGYIQFFETNSYSHKQELRLPEGDYTYYIRCFDLGLNMDTAQVNFNVESDTDSPNVVRAYYEEENLKIITQEEAQCVYDLNGCDYNFDDGTKISTLDNYEHFTSWNTNSEFFIKCKDEYSNQVAQNECSIIVRSVDYS